MRTAAQETAFQIALKICSKEVGEEGQYICDFGGGGMHAIERVSSEGYC